MQHTRRFVIWSAVVLFLGLLMGPASAQEIPGVPAVAACQPGAGYTSGCDVDQDGDIDIFDVQLTAGRWSTSGAYNAGHTHWGETWTGAASPHGLRVEHSAASGPADGLVGVSASSAGRGIYGYAVSTQGTTYGVYGKSDSTAGYGVYGEATATSGTTYGVYGISASTWGSGIVGLASASSGETSGVYGHSSSTWGSGVIGLAGATTGGTIGVYGQAESPNGDGMRGVNSSGTGITNGVRGIASSTAGRGVYGETTAGSGMTYAVYGRASSTEGRGVYGYAAASTGATHGVSGLTASSQGFGVFGEASAGSGTTYGVYGQAGSPNGHGVYGRASNVGGQTYGVYGEAWSSSGRGVYGIASATTGSAYGVQGQSSSTGGRGVYGWATATTGTNYGVYGRADSVSGYGLYGVATASGSGPTYGVYGLSYTTTGYGGKFDGYGADVVYVENLGSGRGMQVYAPSDTGIWAITGSGTAGVDGRASGTTGRGVYGRASSTTGVNYGVYGRTDSASGYAGYFLGNLHTTGTLSKAAGSFKIDHPLDPANQYLYHSFVESPDMKNIYDGVATLDANGAVVVTLPTWFEALNQDFRYQLTPIGAAMPDLHIAQKIEGNVFHIAGGKPGQEVSWQVTGTRHDAYANAHHIPVEEPKPAGERGLYLHPVELGQPAELGLDYQRNLEDVP